jgi:hypothetical protein
MARPKGGKNRNYPALTLEETLEIPQAIQDRASGMPVRKLTLATLVDRSPNASGFRELLLASRAYGLTEGGVNADQFALTPLGHEVTGGDEVARQEALKNAVMNVEPFRVFFTAYDNKKVPSTAALKEFLVSSAGVPADRAEDCIEHIMADARFAGLFYQLKAVDYVDLRGAYPQKTPGEEIHEEEAEAQVSPVLAAESLATSAPRHLDIPVVRGEVEDARQASSTPKKVFIAHGKNRTPLEQLKKMLDQFKVKYAVAVDEPNRGRPISTKVANLMRDDCSSAIFIFTADERFVRETDDGETQEVWRPSENVVYELGAASILYDRRIVIFKEKGVTFPSDFSDLGYIPFESDQLVAEMGNLFSELVALDVLEVRAKG